MPGTGYADYQRVSNQAAAVLFQNTYTISNNNVSPVIDSNGYGYLNIDLQAYGTNANYYIFVQWYTSPSAVTALSESFLSTYPGSETNLQVPVIARWFTFSIHQIAGNLTDQVVVYIFGGNTEHRRVLTNLFPTPFIYGAANVPAGGTSFLLPTRTYQGTAVFAIAQGASNLWVATLDYYDYVGASPTWNTFLAMYGANKGLGGVERVALPPAPVRIALNNTDTVARSIIGSLTIE